MPLQPGKTITKNGKTYILNEHHRWTLKDKPDANPRQAAQKTPQQTQQRAQPQSPGGRTVDRKTFDDSYAKQSQPKFDPSTGLKMPGAGTGTSPGYDGKVRNLEKQGMTTSDAQGISDMEELRNDPNSPIGKPKPQPSQPQRKPKASPKLVKSGVEDDPNHDGVADQARVGVPAFEVPPPPKEIRRLANLTGKAKAAESHFADEFEQDPDGMAEKAHILFTASLKEGDAPVFETDACKKLSPYWQSTDLEQNLDKRSKNRATLNTALHQTANAICKKAFLHHLDTMERGQEILVTVGGCGAGKGFALKNVPQALELKNRANVVWDSAGDQNATENPWILQEARKRGLRVAFVFVHSDPKVSWADPGRGVVKRAQDQNDGRMVDAKVFADSYALGARHHAAFIARHGHDPDVTSVILKNGNPPMLLPGMPEEALQYDRQELAQFAIDTINNDPNVPEHIRRGALGGTQIWED
jgi:hypothetical protein